MRRAREGGYALIIAAVAVLLISIVTSAVLYGAASGRISAQIEVDQARASAIAAAGLDWALLDLRAGSGEGTTVQPKPFGGGAFAVARAGPPYAFISTGTVGEAGGQVPVFGQPKRVARTETTLAYVPQSRFPDADSYLISVVFQSHVIFEVFNLTGARVTTSGLRAIYGGGAEYRALAILVFPEPGLGLSGSSHWFWYLGSPRASGDVAAFASNVTIDPGRQALVWLMGFRRAGTWQRTDMDGTELRVSFLLADGTELPATAVSRAGQ